MRCPPWTRSALAAIVLAGLLVLAGCSKSSSPTRPQPPTPPAPDSPANVVRRFAWGWNRLDRESFRQILAADFDFVYAPGDSAGSLFPGRAFGRDTMLLILQHMFSGGGAEPKLDAVTLQFDPVLNVMPDTRPGKDPGWHKQVLTSVDLHVRAGTVDYRIGGNARFYLTRGDSAAIPADLAAQGAGPDSTRWYMDRWADETLSVIGPAPVAGATRPAGLQATHSTSWGAILALYR